MEKISHKEIFVLTFFLSCFLYPGFGDTLIIKYSGNGIIISTIIGSLIGFLVVLLITSIFDKIDKGNIFDYNVSRFKVFGKVLNVLIIIGILYIIFVESWNIITFIVSQFLTKTSYFEVAFIMFSCLSYFIIKKIEVMSRTSIILFIIFIFMGVLTYIFLVPIIEIDNFKPILDFNKNDFLKSIFMPVCFSSFPLINILSIKKECLIDSKKCKKSIVLGYITSCLFWILYLLLVTGVFDPKMSALFTYPEYTLLKKVNAFNFIQRIENVLAFLIFIAAFIGLGLCFYSIISYIIKVFKLKKNKSINILTYIICITISFTSIYLFKDYLIIDLFTMYPIISFEILIPIILISILSIRKTTKSSS